MATADDLPGAGRVLDTYLYQPAGRWIEHAFMTVAFLFHVKRGGCVRIPLPVPVVGVDSASVSDTSTVSNNPGPGRIIDRYIYQTLGRMLERCAGRIAMATYLSAHDIRVRIEEVWFDAEIKEPCCVCQAASVREMSVEEIGRAHV